MNDRTTIAAMCLEGILSNPQNNGEPYPKAHALDAIRCADALLKELDVGIRDRQAHYEKGRNEALEEAAKLVERLTPNGSYGEHMAIAIRALKTKSEVG